MSKDPRAPRAPRGHPDRTGPPDPIEQCGQGGDEPTDRSRLVSGVTPVCREHQAMMGAAGGRPAFLVVGNERSARRVLGGAIDEYLTFLDPEGAFVKAAGLAKLPAFVHVRLDGSLAGAAEGWDPNAWDDAVERLADAVERLAKEMAWSRPLIPAPGDPPPFPGWNT